jgi:hypothetical protein
MILTSPFDAASVAAASAVTAGAFGEVPAAGDAAAEAAASDVREVAGDAAGVDGALALCFGDASLQPMLQRCAESMREYATRNRFFARIVRRIRASRLRR